MAEQNPRPPSLNPDYQTPQYPPPPEQPQYPPNPNQQTDQSQQYPPPQYPPQSQPQGGYPPPQQQQMYPPVSPQGYPDPSPPLQMAVIVCYSCHHENVVPMTVLSLACGRCGAPNEKPKAPIPNPAPTPDPPVFIPSEPPLKAVIKEEIEQVKEERKLEYLSDFHPPKETKFEISDLGPPFFFPSMREWKWKIMCRGIQVFELELTYAPRHCQEDISLLRCGKKIAFASFSFGKYKIQTVSGETIAHLTLNKGLLGGGEGEFVIGKEMGPMKPGSLRVHIARMGTHKLFDGEKMMVRWGQDHSTLTIEVEENTDPALMLLAVCCFQRWG